MRNRFDEQLFELNREIIEMGAMCERAVAQVTEAMGNGDLKLISRVREEAPVIDRMERDIESLCMKLLLHQQPVAGDLRLVSAALKMITDMERIGDQAEDIAMIVAGLNGRRTAGMDIIEKMGGETVRMVAGGVEAFAQKDADAARRLIERDDIVDTYFSKIKRGMITLIAEHPSEGELALDSFMIAKYFERIGDHAVNIAGWVIYSITGMHREAEI